MIGGGGGSGGGVSVHPTTVAAAVVAGSCASACAGCAGTHSMFLRGAIAVVIGAGGAAKYGGQRGGWRIEHCRPVVQWWVKVTVLGVWGGGGGGGRGGGIGGSLSVPMRIWITGGGAFGGCGSLSVHRLIVGAGVNVARWCECERWGTGASIYGQGRLMAAARSSGATRECRMVRGRLSL